MKNNTLNIRFQGETMVNIPQNFRESFRCTSIEGAKKALKKRTKENVVEAVFTDKSGNTTKLI